MSSMNYDGDMYLSQYVMAQWRYQVPLENSTWITNGYVLIGESEIDFAEWLCSIDWNARHKSRDYNKNFRDLLELLRANKGNYFTVRHN